MNVTNATWADAARTTVKATYEDGLVRSVPNTEHNLNRFGITAWETEGNTIGEFVAPPAQPRTVAGAYFRAALTDLGHMTTVRAALTNPIDLELFNTASEFNDAAPDVNAVATALSIDLSSVFDRADEIRAARQS
jgi:hypothetical protein